MTDTRHEEGHLYMATQLKRQTVTDADDHSQVYFEALHNGKPCTPRIQCHDGRNMAIFVRSPHPGCSSLGLMIAGRTGTIPVMLALSQN